MVVALLESDGNSIMISGLVGLFGFMLWATGYRRTRQFWPILVGGLLLYRGYTFHDQQTDLLTQFASEIRSLCCLSPAIRAGLGDLLGLLLLYTLANILFVTYRSVRNIQSSSQLLKSLAEILYSRFKHLSVIRNLIQAEVVKLEQSLDVDLKSKSRAYGPPNAILPEKGLSDEEILSLMEIATKAEDPAWKSGLVSGAVYHCKEKHINLLNQAFCYYSMSNALFPSVWPSVMKFESEIIAMAASLVKGSEEGIVGSTTSGGSESILLAIKAHRDYYGPLHGITAPEVVCACSAHAAVDKACQLMGIHLVKVPIDPNTMRMDLSAARAAITANTIMLFASAPSYPHGAIDDIEGLGALALEYSIGLHVDGCLGGFFLPFAKQAGCSIPPFDFSVPGVTSMSLDIHKYGYSMKGASIVLYRYAHLRHAQYFCCADWTGGLFTTPTIAGSRGGGLLAQAWASMMSMGQAQYRAHSLEIWNSTRSLAEGIRGLAGLEIYGQVDGMVVCFGSRDKAMNIYCVSDEMLQRGWKLSSLQSPPCVHLCVTLTHVGHEERFLRDLRECVQVVREQRREGKGQAAIYGMTSSLPDGPVSELLKTYNDIVLKL